MPHGMLALTPLSLVFRATWRRQLRCTGLHQVLATVPLRPDSKGLAAQSGKARDFREDFNQGLEYAVEGGSPLLHVLSGVVEQKNYAVSSAQFVDNMRWAIEEAARHDVKVVIGAINQTLVPGYFIRTLAAAAIWTQRLEGLALILDLYHAAMERLDPLKLPQPLPSSIRPFTDCRISRTA